jgi:hypothetical protein
MSRKTEALTLLGIIVFVIVYAMAAVGWLCALTQRCGL